MAANLQPLEQRLARPQIENNELLEAYQTGLKERAAVGVQHLEQAARDEPNQIKAQGTLLEPSLSPFHVS